MNQSLSSTGSVGQQLQQLISFKIELAQSHLQIQGFHSKQWYILEDILGGSICA